MNQNGVERVITYVPQMGEEELGPELRGARLGLYLYTNKLGLIMGFCYSSA